MTDLRDQPTPDQLAAIAVELTVRVRDHGPADNGRWLTHRLPNPGDWFRLAFVLAAAIPDDQPWTDLTAWARPAAAVTRIHAERPEPLAESKPLKPHGTIAAVTRHRYRREPLCQPCRDAYRVYDRERKRARRALTPDRRTA